MLEPTVEAQVKDGVSVLTITYDSGQMFASGGVAISDKLRTRYDQVREKGTNGEKPQVPHCVLYIEADTGGSPLIRALFEFYKELQSREGQLKVVTTR